MKTMLTLLLLLMTASAFAQKMPDIGLYKVRIEESDKTIVAGINEVSPSPPAKPTLFYYWYSANQVHTTQGGYSGRLLDGVYIEYYPDKNLKEEGTFKKGLKNDTWKSWNQDGTLKQVIQWKSGSIFIKHPLPLWEKLHLWKKRHQSEPLDTLAKP
jgi:hypothetical protein